MVVHRGNLQERERKTEVAEPPGQETETPTQDLEKVYGRLSRGNPTRRTQHVER
jgi:hypothetical protein